MEIPKPRPPKNPYERYKLAYESVKRTTNVNEIMNRELKISKALLFRLLKHADDPMVELAQDTLKDWELDYIFNLSNEIYKYFNSAFKQSTAYWYDSPESFMYLIIDPFTVYIYGYSMYYYNHELENLFGRIIMRLVNYLKYSEPEEYLEGARYILESLSNNQLLYLSVTLYNNLPEKFVNEKSFMDLIQTRTQRLLREKKIKLIKPPLGLIFPSEECCICMENRVKYKFHPKEKNQPSWSHTICETCLEKLPKSDECPFCRVELLGMNGTMLLKNKSIEV